MVCGGGGEVRVKEGVEVELREGVGEGGKEGGGSDEGRRLLGHFLDPHIESWIPGRVTAKS